MSIFSNLTPEQVEKVKNCKSKEELEELLKGFSALSADQLDAVSGGCGWWLASLDYDKCYDHTYWTGNENCYLSCPCYWHCDNVLYSRGDTCEDVKPENVSSDFASGRITGADFFA